MSGQRFGEATMMSLIDRRPDEVSSGYSTTQPIGKGGRSGSIFLIVSAGLIIVRQFSTNQGSEETQGFTK